MLGRPSSATAAPDAFDMERAVTDHRTDARALVAGLPAGALGSHFGDRILQIRRRIAEGVYDNTAVIAAVASLLLDSGELG